MNNCIFCKIVRGEIPKTFDYEDENIVAFPDINPAAPIHLLIVPKKHIEDLYNADESTVAAMHAAIRKLVDKLKLNGQGYRITINSGGAQLLPHLHFHLRAPMSKHAKL